jgi:DNA-damage-inducible protein D
MSADLDPRAVDGGLHTTTAPFDAIRVTTLEGREYWSARDLMPLLGYDQWRNFAEAVARARISGNNAGHDMASHIAGASKMVTIGSGADRAIDDYHLSRLACYLVAMNGDPRKPEVAAAQTYFAVRTREAETSPAAAPPPAVMPTHSEALRGWAAELERAELAEARVAQLEPPAAAWAELAEAAGDYSVADAAKVLSRDPHITIKERALFAYMAGLEWVYRREGRWKAYRSQLDTGRLAEKVAKPFYHAGRDELVAGDPTVRITPKGLQELHRRLGGSGQLALMEAVS